MNIKDKPIEDMDLSIRTYNNCKRAGIKTIGDILEMPILARPHVGYKSMCEVKGVLRSKYGSTYTDAWGRCARWLDELMEAVTR